MQFNNSESERHVNKIVIIPLYEEKKMRFQFPTILNFADTRRSLESYKNRLTETLALHLCALVGLTFNFYSSIELWNFEVILSFLEEAE
jgi:hypothetical protein